MALPFTITHLCGHAQRYQPDCLDMQPLALLRSRCCPKCQEIAISVDFARLVLGTLVPWPEPQDRRFIEEMGRAPADDSRLKRASMAGTTYLCFPKGYPWSIAIRTAGEQGPTYQVIYQA